MKKYNKTNWVDHIVDIDTGEVIQHGTPISARHLNNIEEGIYSVTSESIKNTNDIISLAIEVAVLKNASLNNLNNNVFFINLENADSIKVENGVYDPIGKRIYA